MSTLELFPVALSTCKQTKKQIVNNKQNHCKHKNSILYMKISKLGAVSTIN